MTVRGVLKSLTNTCEPQLKLSSLSRTQFLSMRQLLTKPPWVMSAVATVAVALAYFLAARLSLALLEKPDGVAVFWPAAGVATGVLIGAGSRARWPVIGGVMAATIGANL